MSHGNQSWNQAQKVPQKHYKQYYYSNNTDSNTDNIKAPSPLYSCLIKCSKNYLNQKKEKKKRANPEPLTYKVTQFIIIYPPPLPKDPD